MTTMTRTAYQHLLFFRMYFSNGKQGACPGAKAGYSGCCPLICDKQRQLPSLNLPKMYYLNGLAYRKTCTLIYSSMLQRSEFKLGAVAMTSRNHRPSAPSNKMFLLVAVPSGVVDPSPLPACPRADDTLNKDNDLVKSWQPMLLNQPSI